MTITEIYHEYKKSLDAVNRRRRELRDCLACHGLSATELRQLQRRLTILDSISAELTETTKYIGQRYCSIQPRTTHKYNRRDYKRQYKRK